MAILAQIKKTSSGEELSYFYNDDLGSRRAVISSSGALIEEIKYTAFGELKPGYNRERASFTGKQLDATGLYYFNARYYDPDSGRFLTQDPNKQGSGWYTYCNNNPINLTDPSGRDGVIPYGDVGSELDFDNPSYFAPNQTIDFEQWYKEMNIFTSFFDTRDIVDLGCYLLTGNDTFGNPLSPDDVSDLMIAAALPFATFSMVKTAGNVVDAGLTLQMGRRGDFYPKDITKKLYQEIVHEYNIGGALTHSPIGGLHPGLIGDTTQLGYDRVRKVGFNWNPHLINPNEPIVFYAYKLNGDMELFLGGGQHRIIALNWLGAETISDIPTLGVPLENFLIIKPSTSTDLVQGWKAGIEVIKDFAAYPKVADHVAAGVRRGLLPIIMK